MAHMSMDAGSTTIVVTSRINLIPQWEKEFRDNGVSTENIVFLCTPSAHKIPRKCTLLIVDEAHRALSPVYRGMFEAIDFESILCLTATVPESDEYNTYLQGVAPLVYGRNLKEVRSSSGVISEFSIYNLSVAFEKKQKIVHDAFNKKFSESTILLNRYRMSNSSLIRQYPSVFDLAKDLKGAYDQSDPVKWARQFWLAMTMRKNAIYGNEFKIKVAKKIIDDAPSSRK